MCIATGVGCSPPVTPASWRSNAFFCSSFRSEAIFNSGTGQGGIRFFPSPIGRGWRAAPGEGTTSPCEWFFDCAHGRFFCSSFRRKPEALLNSGAGHPAPCLLSSSFRRKPEALFNSGADHPVSSLLSFLQSQSFHSSYGGAGNSFLYSCKEKSHQKRKHVGLRRGGYALPIGDVAQRPRLWTGARNRRGRQVTPVIESTLRRARRMG
jgi:hypothetical protein